ncbi:hypothetical protein bsdtb5_27020 [Anaeromicropila herbilytica]|uniref:Stage II sporulation protein M n=2 Tax=Anaeromicropila herbilytica TaxID=2785025 RepID=A0A7R7EM96_9FIRM|nr:hypothetical protein bsdtb5_27020 [Anaeromicropila herbilytica]
MKGKIFRLDVKSIAIFLLIFGVIIGTLFANIFKGVYLNNTALSDNIDISKIGTLNINYINLLKYVLINNYKKYFLIWLFNVTILGIPFMTLFIFYHGFCAGFIIAITTMQYGMKGILLFLTYLFPQYIIYIPVYIITLWKGYEICRGMNHSTNKGMKSKLQYAIKQLPIVLILGVILFLGCILETYLNTYFIQKVSNLL